jgi:ubiquinone/menaquinone biosynthesis C-methylase UbiE
MLSEAEKKKELLGLGNVSFLERDQFNNGFGDSEFDMAYNTKPKWGSNVCEYENLVKECTRVLKPNGHFVQMSIYERVDYKNEFENNEWIQIARTSDGLTVASTEKDDMFILTIYEKPKMKNVVLLHMYQKREDSIQMIVGPNFQVKV